MGEFNLLGVPVTVRQSRLGGFLVASPFVSWGLLGLGETEEAAIKAAEAEISRRRAVGAGAVEAVRAKGLVLRAFSEAEKGLLR